MISSDPAAGTPALQGTVVNLVVAAPLSSVQVPGDVIGMTEVEARALLQAPPYDFVVTTDVRSSPTVAGRHRDGDPSRPRRADRQGQ